MTDIVQVKAHLGFRADFSGRMNDPAEQEPYALIEVTAGKLTWHYVGALIAQLVVARDEARQFLKDNPSPSVRRHEQEAEARRHLDD